MQDMGLMCKDSKNATAFTVWLATASYLDFAAPGAVASRLLGETSGYALGQNRQR